MKGKKSDIEFISNYIQQCSNKNIQTTHEIYNKCISEISEIDAKIAEIQDLKNKRIKLADVKMFLEKKQRVSPIDFFKISNKNAANLVANYIKNKPLHFSEINKICNLSESDALFCAKQLISLNILSKNKKGILEQSINFNQFLDFLSSNYNNIC